MNAPPPDTRIAFSTLALCAVLTASMAILSPSLGFSVPSRPPKDRVSVGPLWATGCRAAIICSCVGGGGKDSPRPSITGSATIEEEEEEKEEEEEAAEEEVAFKSTLGAFA